MRKIDSFDFPLLTKIFIASSYLFFKNFFIHEIMEYSASYYNFFFFLFYLINKTKIKEIFFGFAKIDKVIYRIIYSCQILVVLLIFNLYLRKKSLFLKDAILLAK